MTRAGQSAKANGGVVGTTVPAYPCRCVRTLAQTARSDRYTRINTTSLRPAFAPLSKDPCALSQAIGRVIRRVPIRDVLLAAAIVLAASVVVHAEEHNPDWIPDVLTFPDDAEVVKERTIGSTIRLFSISTDADVDALLADWEESLNANGYPITQKADDLLDRSIEFTGPGITNAKIIVAPVTEEGRSLIQFDATLN